MGLGVGREGSVYEWMDGWKEGGRLVICINV